MKNLVLEYLQGKAVIKHDNYNIELSDNFKKVYKERCVEKGIIPFMDFEIFKHSPNSCKSTVFYSLTKELQNQIRTL